MKFIKLLILGALLVLNIACLKKATAKADAQKFATLILGTSPDYPPYESINKSGEVVGFDIDVAQGIAKKMGKKLKIKQMTFDALVLALAQGKIDMIMSGLSSTLSRRKKIALIPYQGEPIKAYTLLFWENLPTNIKTYADLKNVKKSIYCAQVGTTMAEHLQQIPDITVKTLESTPDLLLDVIYKKSAAALVEPNVAVKLKKQKPKLQLLALDLPRKDWVMGYGIGVNKNNKHLVEDIEKAVAEFKSMGEIAKLEKQWLKNK